MQHFHSIIFGIGNSSTEIPSPPLGLSVVMLPKAHLTLHFMISGSRLTQITHCGYLSHENFLYSSSVYSCHLFLMLSASDRSIHFLSFIVLTFAWNVPLVSLIFLKRSLVFPILFFSLYFFALITEEVFLIPPCYSLELCILLGMSFSFAFHFSSFLSYLQGLHRQLFCLFAFLFLGDGLDHCLWYNVMNLPP